MSAPSTVCRSTSPWVSAFPTSEFGLEDDMNGGKNQGFSYLTIIGGLRILF